MVLLLYGYVQALTSETHMQVSETARTRATAGHSGESGWEHCHTPSGKLSLGGTTPLLLVHVVETYVITNW